MGCDIHLYKEKFVGGKWVPADEWVASEYEDEPGLHVPWEKRFTKRNYNLFGLLSSGVRRECEFSFQPRGLPFNCCAEVKEHSDGWGSDGHSHSYLYLHELKEMLCYLKTATIHVSGMKDRAELVALRESIAGGAPDWNLLFPYCQMTNNPNCDEFEFDVPADFYMGTQLQQIIDGFNGVDGENHRIVFFFDN